MTVMTDAVDTSAVAKKKTPASTPEGVDAELVGRLVEQARAAGLELTGHRGRRNPSQRSRGQDRADRRRSGRDPRAGGPGRFVRAADRPQAAAAADRCR